VRSLSRLASLAFPLGATGCQLAPSVSFLGSFFPAWILCAVVGLLLTLGARQILLRIALDPHLDPRRPFYPCLAVLFTFGLWLIFFGG
jgi:hypothetical protein